MTTLTPASNIAPTYSHFIKRCEMINYCWYTV